MVAEVDELANGWPLGLENMNIRLRILASLQAAGEPYAPRIRSASFDSFTTSELNTESTRSFFQDNSVSLGRLIGLKPGQGGDFYLKTDSIRVDECHQRVSVGSAAAAAAAAPSKAIKRHEISRGNCIPMLLNVLVKITPCKGSTSRG